MLATTAIMVKGQSVLKLTSANNPDNATNDLAKVAESHWM